MIHNTTTNSTNSTFVIVSRLKPGITYEFAVRGITNLGLGPPSEVLRFIHAEEVGVQVVPGSSSVPSSNTYIIIAIVCAAILVSTFLLAAVYLIYHKRNISKCPHYFNKGDGGTWSAYSGCWEHGSTAGGISTTRYNDGITVTSLNNARYGDVTLAALGHMHGVNKVNGLYGSDCRSRYYGTADNKNVHHDILRTTEDLMYEDPEGLRLVSFKGHQNQRGASPEPYATTPLIIGSVDGLIYPRPLNTEKNITRLPLNIPHMVDQSHNFNSHPDKGSSPVLQFPPPPPPHLSGSDTSTSTNSKEGGSLFLQHLPYHPTNDSNSSHQTSPLLHTKSKNPRHVSPNRTKSSDSQKNHSSQPQGMFNFSSCPPPSRAAMEDWLSSGGRGLCPPVEGMCPSPQSSALGDADESDDKDDSCWSDGSNNDESTTNGSLSSLQPDINWAEAVRHMSESKWNGLKMENGDVRRADGGYHCPINSSSEGTRSQQRSSKREDAHRYSNKGHMRNASLSSPLV